MFELAQQNFKRWNDALQNGNPNLVAALYTSDNTFLPTLSPEFKQGIPGAIAYFQHFLEKNPFGEIIAEQVQNLNDKSYIHSGMYNFEVGSPDNRSIVEARFTFVWIKTNSGEWKIAHHHSSLKPQS